MSAIDQQPASFDDGEFPTCAVAISSHINPDLAPTSLERAPLGRQRHRGLVDLDVGLHSDLHARLVADCRGDELVAGGR